MNSQSKRRIQSTLGKLFQKIAPEIGAEVLLEPQWGAVGHILFKSGKRSYFKYNTTDINPRGASAIATDKDYANFFIEKLGYPTIPYSRTFFSKTWGETIGVFDRGIDDAYRYAQRIGFPVYIKPNSGSQGIEVSLVYTKPEFYRGMRAIFRQDKVALVQKPVLGRDYRLVVLDDVVISAYERTPLAVVGTGHHTVAELLEKKREELLHKKRDVVLSAFDPRIASKLSRSGLTIASVIPKGTVVPLLDNANLSAGGDALDVSTIIHRGFREIAVSLTESMGLRLCGLDLIVEGDIRDAPLHYYVLEINSSPGLDHYARSGKKQKMIVEECYRKVLQALEKSI